MSRPQPFGPYDLIERVNVGGMAEIFRAVQRQTRRRVALKRILPSVAEDEEFISMFRDEATIASQLDHPNIARIYDIGRVDTSYYIALEYVEGRDMRTIQDHAARMRRSMPLDFVLYVATNLCKGLDYAHQRKDSHGKPMSVVHRDVSPQNVLVSYEGDAKLIDFGIAKAAGKLARTQVGAIKGKFGYMSPEQVRGLPVDKRSDIFSVGICLWEFLTMQRLFHGDNEIIVMEKIRNAEVPPPTRLVSSIPVELERIVMRALAKDADDRYTSAADLLAELSAFAHTEGIPLQRDRAAAYMRQNFSDDAARTAAPREEAHAMAENKGGSDLDVFEGLARKPQARPATPPPSVPLPMPGARPSGAAPPPPPPARARTLLGMAPVVPPPPSGAPGASRVPPLPSHPGMAAPPLPAPLPTPGVGAVPPLPAPPLPAPGLPPPASVPARPSGMLPAVAPPPPRTSAPPPPGPGAPTRGAMMSAPGPLPAPTPPPMTAPGAAAVAPGGAAPATVDMDWDDEDEKTHVYDKEDGSPGSPSGRPMPAAGTPAPPPSAAAAAALMARSGNAAAAMPRPPSLPPGPVPSQAPTVPAMRAAMSAPAGQPAPAEPATLPLPAKSSGGGKSMMLVAVIAALAIVGAVAIFMFMPRNGTLKIYVAGPGGKDVEKVEIFVDGRKVCESSPCTLEVKAGRHDVKAVAEGYERPAPQPVDVKSNDQTPYKLELRSASAGTGFTVAGAQEGLKVSVDGKEIGPLPQTIKDLTPGEHKLRFTASDRYKPEEKTINVTADKVEDLGTIKLQVLKGKANLQLVTKGARIILVASNGEKRQIEEKMFKDGQLPIDIDTSKTWQLEATKQGHDDLKIPISFDDGVAEKTFKIELFEKGKAPPPEKKEPVAAATTTENKTPEKTPEKTPDAKTAAAPATGDATLNINSIPPGASVLVDGRPVGPTPRSGVKVAPGSHTITFIHPEKGKKSAGVTVKAGETKGVGVKF